MRWTAARRRALREQVTVEVDGEPLVASLGRVEDGRAVLDPNGVVVIKR